MKLPSKKVFGPTRPSDHHTMPETNPSRGRKPDATSKSGQIRSLLATGASVGDIAKKVGCSTNLVYNVKARMGGAGQKRGPGRPPKAATPVPTANLGSIESIIAVVKNAEQQRAQLHGVLVRIQQMVAAALN